MIAWWLSWWRICLQCRRPGFDPWDEKVPWKREWHPTPIFLAGEFHGQGSLVSYSPWGLKESDTTDQLIHFHDHWPFLLLISKLLLNLSSKFFISGTVLSDLEFLFSYLLQLPFLCCCFPSVHLWSCFPLSFSYFKVLICYIQHLGYSELVSIDWLFYTFTLIWVIFLCFFLCPVIFFCMVDIVDIMFLELQILLSSFKEYWILFSVLFSHSVMSNSLRPHELQHARLPCPSQTPGVYSDSCPLSWWCHPTISSSVISFFSHLQSFRASGSFQMSQFFTSAGKNIGVSALANQSFQWIFRADSFNMDWLDLLVVQGTLKSLLQHHSSKASILQCSAFFIVQLSYPYMTTGKTIALTDGPLLTKKCLCFLIYSLGWS